MNYVINKFVELFWSYDISKAGGYREDQTALASSTSRTSNPGTHYFGVKTLHRPGDTDKVKLHLYLVCLGH
jgi:hypothetical protein